MPDKHSPSQVVLHDSDAPVLPAPSHTKEHRTMALSSCALVEVPNQLRSLQFPIKIIDTSPMFDADPNEENDMQNGEDASMNGQPALLDGAHEVFTLERKKSSGDTLTKASPVNARAATHSTNPASNPNAPAGAKLPQGNHGNPLTKASGSMCYIVGSIKSVKDQSNWTHTMDVSRRNCVKVHGCVQKANFDTSTLETQAMGSGTDAQLNAPPTIVGLSSDPIDERHYLGPYLTSNFSELSGNAFARRMDGIRKALSVRGQKKATKCAVCFKVFKREINLRKHVKAVHLKKMSSQCAVCGKLFGYKSARDKHVRTIHCDFKPWHCAFEGCGRRFSERGNALKHFNKLHAKAMNGIGNEACSGLDGKKVIYVDENKNKKEGEEVAV